jgi:arginase
MVSLSICRLTVIRSSGGSVHRTIALVGAPSSIGIKPYDDGTMRRLDLAPAALREQGLADRLKVRDVGDVVPPPYRDFTRPAGKPRNEGGVGRYSHALAARVAGAVDSGDFALVLGGDCSIILGCLLGVRRKYSRVGLIYVDAHGDFATPDTSRTGSVASMCLALAVGRGDSPLARLQGAAPLVRAEDLVVIGRRDEADTPWYGQEQLRAGPMLDLPHPAIREHGTAEIARLALERVGQPGVDAFWIHVDADVLDPSVVPAVDSPVPDGLSLDQLAELVTLLVRPAGAIGLDLTIYDPQLDPDRSSAARLAQLLERGLTSSQKRSDRS